MCRDAFVAFALFLILFCDATSSECTQQGPCICTLSDGYYNLSALADQLPLEDTLGDYTIYFHPCTNVKIKTQSNIMCANESKLSVCIFDKQKNLTQSFGTIEETTMKLPKGNKYPIFELHHNNITLQIDIICLPNSNGTNFKIDKGNKFPPSSSNQYRFFLISPYGCKESYKGLSTGSVLLILFFTVTGIYFIGGIVTLRILRGATGWEMLPNHDFWSNLPLLVRDGIVFTFNCCRADSYERI
ncbi:uncharacterized protein LOC105252892 isoform X1 [Camponotus floridanus]|uniref:uncharacterized protein LOC105252892 isoform X1 n=1 Tax=Camponotus floridanus TaxID=104421 RepID=UPI00059B800C|nr:uncharacterized protein LOC105252892 isoform X1 [Camponotus floridanus]